MDRLIYTAMNGAQRTLEQQDVITNNLANAKHVRFSPAVGVLPLRAGEQ